MLFAALVSGAQTAPTATSPRDWQDFPLLLHAKLIAGRAHSGTSVQGKLLIATFVHGMVVPAGAMFTGVLEQSVAKSATTPSRLKVHITSASWRDQTIAVELYLANYYYPMPGQFLTAAERMEFETGVGMRRMNHRRDSKVHGAAGYPQRVRMKGVEVERGEDGALAITSTDANLHLYGNMVYCFQGAVVDEKKPGAK